MLMVGTCLMLIATFRMLGDLLMSLQLLLARDRVADNNCAAL